jgi:hypothetical protein
MKAFHFDVTFYKNKTIGKKQIHSQFLRRSRRDRPTLLRCDIVQNKKEFKDKKWNKDKVVFSTDCFSL